MIPVAIHGRFKSQSLKPVSIQLSLSWGCWICFGSDGHPGGSESIPWSRRAETQRHWPSTSRYEHPFGARQGSSAHGRSELRLKSRPFHNQPGWVPLVGEISPECAQLQRDRHQQMCQRGAPAQTALLSPPLVTSYPAKGT